MHGLAEGSNNYTLEWTTDATFAGPIEYDSDGDFLSDAQSCTQANSNWFWKFSASPSIDNLMVNSAGEVLILTGPPGVDVVRQAANFCCNARLRSCAEKRRGSGLVQTLNKSR